jgi:hypothetical protein
MNQWIENRHLDVALAAIAVLVLASCPAATSSPREELAAFEEQVLDDYVAFERAQEPTEENGYTWREYYAHLFDVEHNPRALAIDWLEEFEVKHRGTQVGLDALHAALGYLCYLDYSQDLAHEKAPAFYELLIEHYSECEGLGEICYFGNLHGDGDEFVATMDMFIAMSPHRSVKARATAAKMRVFKSADMFDEEIECAELLIESYSDVLYQNTPCGELAEESLLPPYSEGLLQVGSTAPDVAGYDVDGNPVALRDLRGKVVVMSFFGFW